MRRTISCESGLLARTCDVPVVDCRPCGCGRIGLLLVEVGLAGWLSVAVLLPEFADVEVCDVAELDVRCGIEVVEVCRLCCDIAKGDQPRDFLSHLNIRHVPVGACDGEAAVDMIVTGGGKIQHQNPLTPIIQAPKLVRESTKARQAREAPNETTFLSILVLSVVLVAIVSICGRGYF